MRSRVYSILALALALASSGRAEELPSRPGPRIGISLRGEANARTIPAPESGPATPARIEVSWADIEAAPGTYDWSAVLAGIRALREQGREVSVAVGGGHPVHLPGGGRPSPLDGTSLQAWSDFVRSAVRALGPSIEVLELGDGPRAGQDPSVYAFVLKNVALAARAEAQALGVSLRLAQGAIPAGRLSVQESLWEADVAPYVDVLPILWTDLPEGGGDPSGTIDAFRLAAAEHPPAPELWVVVEAADAVPGGGWDRVATAVRGLAAAADRAFVEVRGDDPAFARVTRWCDGMAGWLGPAHAPSPSAGLSVTDPEGAPIRGGAILGRFLDGEDFSTVIVYRAPGDLSAAEPARVLLDSADVRDPRVADPETRTEAPTGGVAVPGHGSRAVAVLRADRPLVLAHARAAAAIPGLETETEDLRIEARRELTVEEVLARYRQVQKVQDDRVLRWTAKAKIEFTFRFAQTGASVDVGIDANYFWERGKPVEWEQTRYTLNGNLIRWKEIPELPLIQPEKVITLPLDLNLDKAYAYRMIGEDEIDGHPCYVAAFEPIDPSPGRSLYRGRVWIDKDIFVLRRQNVVQTNLEAPVLSNEEFDRFAPFRAPDGSSAWLIERATGQQLWSAGGRNFVVERRLRFESYEINPPEERFEAERARAYASTNRMLRDTEEGIRYLERTEDGGRVVKREMDTSQLFAAAGAYKDDSTDGVVPLAGVNWFDYRFLGRDAQFNVLFGGVVAFVNLTDPEAFGTRMDLTVEGIGSLLKSDDKLFVSGEEVTFARIEQRSQFLQARLGKPLGSFFKVTATGSLQFRSFYESDEGRDALPSSLEFVLPADHRVATAGLQAEFNRRGYSVTAEGGVSRRSEWRPWGLYDPVTGIYYDVDPMTGNLAPTVFDPDTATFTTWGVTAFKEWSLPRFQKIRAEVNYLDGSDLDRFSTYEFSLFGSDRLSGFAGTGVRFDRGYVARTSYVFNLLQAVRFGVQLESALTRDRTFDTEDRSFTGLGVSGNVVGPWKTVWQVSWGRALDSDIAGLEGKQEFLVLVLKLF
jgi:hypothetical protein